MTIRDPQKHQDSMWDWAILNGCFSGRISPTDVDGLVERNGHFLFLETKGRGVEITQGQRITFTNLARQPRTTILVAWGNRNTPEEMAAIGDFATQCEWITTDKSFPCGLDEVRRFCREWFLYAEANRLRKVT